MRTPRRAPQEPPRSLEGAVTHHRSKKEEEAMRAKWISGMTRTLLALGLALGVAGAALAQQKAVVRLADQPGAEVDYAAVWVAELNGYFDEEGIKIDRRTYANGPAALLELPSGNVDAVMAGL